MGKSFLILNCHSILPSPRDSLGNLPVVPPGSPVYDGCYAGSPPQGPVGNRSIHQSRGGDGRALTPTPLHPPQLSGIFILDSTESWDGGWGVWGNARPHPPHVSRPSTVSGRSGRARSHPPNPNLLASLLPPAAVSEKCGCQVRVRVGAGARPHPPTPQTPFMVSLTVELVEPTMSSNRRQP